MLEQEQRPAPAAPLHIDFLYWEDCPSHERALELLRDVIREEDVPADVYVQRVDTDEQAEALRFPGSPTMRVNGLDIDGNPALPPGLSCRVYYRADGRMTPLPPREKIVAAIRQAVREPQNSALAGCSPQERSEP